MMDCGTKTLIFITLCALVGANSEQKIERNLEILVSVPSTHLGDTEIGPAVLTITGGHPLLYRVVVQKNEAQCINSTNPQCTSSIKEPIVHVSVNSSASNGKSFTYSETINASQQLVIVVDAEVSVTPQMVNGANDKLLVLLDVLYDSNRTSRGSLSSWRAPQTFSLNVNFTNIQEDNGEGNDQGHGQGNGQGNGQGHGQGNGQSSLRSAPLISLLLALLPVFLLK